MSWGGGGGGVAPSSQSRKEMETDMVQRNQSHEFSAGPKATADKAKDIAKTDLIAGSRMGESSPLVGKNISVIA